MEAKVKSRSSEGKRAAFATAAGLAMLLAVSMPMQAQRGRGAQPPATPRAAAPIDLIGYWVSIVTEDWIWRMTTPQKGDIGAGPTGGFNPIPLNPEGRRVTLAWDPAKDDAEGNQCRSYGAGNIMNVPGRFHLTWVDDTTLQLDVDAGMQRRVFHFGGSAPQNLQSTWQGYSIASWEGMSEFERTHLGTPQGRGQLLTQTFGEGGGSRGGNLKVVTTNMRAGYLRKNGVPYSDKAVLEEHFRVFKEPNGDVWLITTSLIDDPQYLSEPFIVSRTFKKETDGSKWSPSPCTAR